MKIRPGDTMTVGKGGYVWQVTGWNVASGLIQLTREDPTLGVITQKVHHEKLRRHPK